jgi:cell division septum initiation protein DivIVA
MTDKEFKRLNRAQLIEIIYRLQLQVDELTEQKQALESALEDRRLRIHNAGNIAEAALELNNCFLSAQNAADQYLNEIRVLHAEAEEERQRLLDNAHAEAEKIIENAKKEQSSQKFNYGTEFERLWVNLQMTGEEA